MNIIVHGSTGRMGRKLQELLTGSATHTMVAAVSPEEEILKTLNDYRKSFRYKQLSMIIFR